jgi:putative DNA primase/helicase
MTIPQEDIFDQTNDRALAAYPGLLQEWIPGGKVVGHEYKALNPTRADQSIGSFSINVHNGKWLDGATGDEGGDPISLFAYLKCGGTDRAHRIQACKELAEKFGLDDTAPAKKRPHLRVVKPEPKDEWKPQVPPPEGVPEPTAILAKWDHVFRYLDPHGQLLRYVLRNDKTALKKKEIFPLTYGYLKDKNHAQGETGWHLKHPDKPRGLYGLDRLDGRDVLLQEGELKTDLAALNLPQYACLSLTAGSGGALHNDLEPLRGRRVILCPDQDFAGRKGATQVAALLRAIGCTVTLIDMTGQPDKWDLGNAVTGKQDGYPDQEPWDGERLEEFLKARSVPSFENPDADPEGSLDLEPPDMGEWKEDGGSDDKRRQPPIPLGYDKDVHYYLSPMKRQIFALTPSQHTAQHLTSMADLNGYWMRREDLKNDKGSVNWTLAAAKLMSFCSDVGIYKPDLVRGRGAYLEDDGRPVMHVGEHLMVEGEICPLMLPKSRYIYEAGLRLNQAIADPIAATRASELLKICQMLPWEKPIYATLMAGWLVVAPICGALFWRPSIWVTGGSGSGKSTLETRIVQPILGGMGRRVQGGTTEAGIRQLLGMDALPVVFDEAEAESQHAKVRMQSTLDLVRQSSSEGGAEIVKGTQSQTGVKRYHIRSCFMFSSINVFLENRADESRVSVLELRNAAGRDGQKAFDEFLALIEATITPEFCAGLIARNVAMMPTILENARTFSRAVATELNSARVGDQIGTMLAGAYALEKDCVVSAETALKWVRKKTWDDTTSADAMTDERRMLNHLMQRRVRLDLGGNKFMDLTISELIGIASGEDGDTMAGVANKELRRNGIKFEAGGVWISNSHTSLKEHLKDTPWSSQWPRTLRRLPGTKALKREDPGIKFAGELGRATFVPLDLIG